MLETGQDPVDLMIERITEVRHPPVELIKCLHLEMRMEDSELFRDCTSTVYESQLTLGNRQSVRYKYQGVSNEICESLSKLRVQDLSKEPEEHEEDLVSLFSKLVKL